MKILLIMPSIKPRASLYERLVMKLTMWSSLTLQQIAALTDDKHEVAIVDENHEKIKYDGNYDLVAISAFTCIAPRAYEIADRFREKGVKVVLGGYHPTALPIEAKQHADAVVIGEAEGVWQQVLKDAENNKLKAFYKSEPVDGTLIISPVKNNNFSLVEGVEATRGCIYKCNFCAISNSPIGCKFRKKPIERVIKEIESLKCKGFVFYDSSLTLDVNYTKELFRRLRTLNKKFACFGNANILAKDDELLKLAYEAGCVAWAVGFETISQNTIKDIGKKSNRVEEYARVIRKVNDYGMALISSFVFGFDNDTKDVFDATLDMLYKWNIDSIGINILTPFPGTPLFNQLDKENRILTKDWSKYDLYHVVHKPKRLTPDEIYDGINKLIKNFFSFSNIAKKILGKKFDLVTRASLVYHLISSRIVYRSCFG
jgi:radical SAM superfamily enzyme YgiQ (UPF0313 family)